MEFPKRLHLFHPPPEITRHQYLWSAVISITAISVAVSIIVTLIVQVMTRQPDYPGGMIVALCVPLLVVPPLALWHHSVLFELEESKRKIQTLSRTDELTGIFNRRYFFEMAMYNLALARRHGYPISLLIIDLDYFKSVNDRFGHQVGDKVLKRTADTLNNSKRSTDVLGRYGGEEFILLMPQTDGENALNLCRTLHQALAEDQAKSSSTTPTITISIGVASSSRHGYDFDPLLSEADKALYQAKAKG